VVLTAEFIEVIYFTVNGFKLLEDGNVMPKHVGVK
jgi:hypothetical protein